MNMYIVKNLSFHEKCFKWVKAKYNLDIHYYPHFLLSKYLKYGAYCNPVKNTPLLKIKDVEDAARQDSGTNWILSGLKQADSVDRRIYLRTWEDCMINRKGNKAAPLSFWTHKAIIKYIEKNKLYKPDRKGYFSVEISFKKRDMQFLAKNYPKDYELIKQKFPYIDIIGYAN